MNQKLLKPTTSIESTLKKRFLDKAAPLFALHGAAGVSMRKLGEAVGAASSASYYYFPTKKALLKSLFDTVSQRLGEERAKLPRVNTVYEMLAQRVGFQLDHATEVMVVLRYFMTYRDDFRAQKKGFVPESAYRHIQEVLNFGAERNELALISSSIDAAKVMTHAINGFVLEYYPHDLTPKERKELIATITTFLYGGMVSFLSIPIDSQNKKGGEKNG